MPLLNPQIVNGELVSTEFPVNGEPDCLTMRTATGTSIRQAVCSIGFQADILTSESFYSLRLPIDLQPTVTYMQHSSSDTAAGPFRNLTGFPMITKLSWIL